MPASVVQSAAALASTTSITVTLGATPTVGNTLVGMMASDTTSSAVPNAGTSKPYTQRASDVQNMGWYVWTRLVASGDSATTTFTPSTASPTALLLLEIQGTYDKVGTPAATINTAGASRTTTTLTPASSDNIVLALVGIHAIQNVESAASVDNGFSVTLTNFPAGTGNATAAAIVASKVTGAAAATGTSTVSWTGNSLDRTGVQIAFTGIAGGAAPARVRRIGKRR